MGSVVTLDKNLKEVLETLERLLVDCKEGRLSGAIIITEKHDEFGLDIDGTFSVDPDSIAAIMGRLQISSNIFFNMMFEEDEI
jgi:hypothetical protein